MPSTPENPVSSGQERIKDLSGKFVSLIDRAVSEKKKYLETHPSEQNLPIKMGEFNISFNDSYMGYYQRYFSLSKSGAENEEVAYYLLSDLSSDPDPVWRSVIVRERNIGNMVADRPISLKETESLIDVMTSPQLNLSKIEDLMKHSEAEALEIKNARNKLRQERNPISILS